MTASLLAPAEICCYNRVDWRSFNHYLSEKPYFWLFLQNQKYFNHYLSEKPYFWLFLQNQKYFNHYLSEKPYFWLFKQYQKHFNHDLSEKPYFRSLIQNQKYFNRIQNLVAKALVSVLDPSLRRPRGFRQCRAPSWL